MRQTIVGALVVALLAIVSTGGAGQLSASGGAQQTSASPAQHDHAQTPAASPNMQDMMKMHQQMMAEMNAADAKLDQLVQQMNAASGDAKVNATAAVVAELVRQQKAMHEHMGKLHEQMMSGMMMKR